jgi:hypothetical protein
MVLGIGLLLLALFIVGGFRLMSGNSAGKEESSVLERRESPVNGEATSASDASARSVRGDWRRTVESAAAGLTANVDAPVRIGFVQTSPDQRQWRVSLQRTPATGQVLDAAKITIQVETLATADQTHGDGREDLAVDWETQGRRFEEAAAPRLKVTAEKPVSHLRFRVFYDGTEIERRTYSARNGD